MTATPLAFLALWDRPAWLDQVGESPVCAQTDPEVWFPEKGQRAASRQAKRLCGECPLLQACRSWALEHPSLTPYGVWGGLTERERSAIRRHSRQATASGAAASGREAA